MRVDGLTEREDTPPFGSLHLARPKIAREASIDVWTLYNELAKLIVGNGIRTKQKVQHHFVSISDAIMRLITCPDLCTGFEVRCRAFPRVVRQIHGIFPFRPCLRSLQSGAALLRRVSQCQRAVGLGTVRRNVCLPAPRPSRLASPPPVSLLSTLGLQTASGKCTSQPTIVEVIENTRFLSTCGRECRKAIDRTTRAYNASAHTGPYRPAFGSG